MSSAQAPTINTVPDCIFCKIIAGDFNTDFIYEDDHVVAFDDLNPQMPVHALVVPRHHVVNLEDDPDPELLGHVFSAISKVAKLKGVEQSGYRIIQNNGAGAGQTVFHLHVHVLGDGEFTEGIV